MPYFIITSKWTTFSSRCFIPSLGQCPCVAQQELRPPWFSAARGALFLLSANARAWLSRSFALLGSPLFAGLFSFSRPMPVRGSAGASPSLVLRYSRGFFPSLGQCPCVAQQELRPPWFSAIRGAFFLLSANARAWLSRSFALHRFLRVHSQCPYVTPSQHHVLDVLGFHESQLPTLA